jgi:prophage tail gpP-like protein
MVYEEVGIHNERNATKERRKKTKKVIRAWRAQSICLTSKCPTHLTADGVIYHSGHISKEK